MAKINLDKMKIVGQIYYVGVQTGDFENKDYHMTLVTEMDSHTWKAEDDKKPMAMSKKLADQNHHFQNHKDHKHGQLKSYILDNG